MKKEKVSGGEYAVKYLMSLYFAVTMNSEVLAKAMASKEAGNEYFKNQSYSKAVECYTLALRECPQDHESRAVFLKNRAACFLKLDQYSSALDDCTQALRICPSDIKSLYRRSIAYEASGDFPAAFADVKYLLSIDPRNKDAMKLARTLTVVLKKQHETLQSTEGIIKEMFQALSNPDLPQSKVIMAVKNCAILSRERPGALKLYQAGVMDLLLPLLDSESTEAIHHILQTFIGLCMGHKACAHAVVKQISVEKLSILISHENSEVSCSTIGVIKQALLSFSNEDPVAPGDAQSAVVVPAETIVAPLVQMVFTLLLDRVVTSITRDYIMEMLISTVTEVIIMYNHASAFLLLLFSH